MSRALAVFRREFGAWYDSPVAWVATTLFIVTLHVLFFLLGYPIGDLKMPGFWEGREATLIVLFAWLPPLYCLFVPALTMGAWAEERRAGTDELLLTLPLRPLDAVLGKFLASWCLLCLLLVAAVVPLAVVVGSLGPLDWGTVWGGLLGAALLGGACVAVGQFVSAFTQESLIAFLVSALVLFGLWGTTFLLPVLPPELAEVVNYANPATHYLETSARGVFDLRDLVYHGLFVVIGLALNANLVEGRRWR